MIVIVQVKGLAWAQRVETVAAVYQMMVEAGKEKGEGGRAVLRADCNHDSQCASKRFGLGLAGSKQTQAVERMTVELVEEKIECGKAVDRFGGGNRGREDTKNGTNRA
jgi:hypothetical protein